MQFYDKWKRINRNIAERLVFQGSKVPYNMYKVVHFHIVKCLFWRQLKAIEIANSSK